jgi:hypothetical protein
MDARAIAYETVAEAIGRHHRDDAVLPKTGGPAGNARLTAWTGLLLLALSLAELVTLLDVRGLLSWHIAIGVLLIPPALLKTATTSWRIVRYYAGNQPYRVAGPPPLVLRVLGPLVIASTLAVLGSGLALILIGTAASERSLVNLPGLGLSVLMIHKVTFVVWAVCTGLHTLGRLVPAVQLTMARLTPGRPTTTRPAVPGRLRRGGVLGAALVAATVGALVILSLSATGAWRAQPHHAGRHDRQITSTR